MTNRISQLEEKLITLNERHWTAKMHITAWKPPSTVSLWTLNFSYMIKNKIIEKLHSYTAVVKNTWMHKSNSVSLDESAVLSTSKHVNNCSVIWKVFKYNF